MATVTLKGKSGKAYKFEVYDLDGSSSAGAGVYAVTDRHQSTQGGYTHTVIYIGQAHDLGNRFADHHKAKCFTDHGANSLCLHADEYEQSRVVKEGDLIAAYNPPCND